MMLVYNAFLRCIYVWMRAVLPRSLFRRIDSHSLCHGPQFRDIKGIPYESISYYVFDRGYNAFRELYKIHLHEPFLVVCIKEKPIQEVFGKVSYSEILQ